MWSIIGLFGYMDGSRARRSPDKGSGVVTMIHTTQTISALTLLMVSTQSAMADNDLRWREFDPNMSNEEYEDSCRDNQRFIRKFITGYSENALTSVGIPE